MWAKAFGDQGKYPVDQEAAAEVPATPQVATPAPGKTPPPVRKATVAPKPVPIAVPAPEEKPTASLDGVREVIFPIDEAMDPHMVESLVAPAIYNSRFTGQDMVELTIRHWAGNASVEMPLGPFNAAEKDLETIARRIDRYMDGEMEFVR